MDFQFSIHDRDYVRVNPLNRVKTCIATHEFGRSIDCTWLNEYLSADFVIVLRSAAWNRKTLTLAITPAQCDVRGRGTCEWTARYIGWFIVSGYPRDYKNYTEIAIESYVLIFTHSACYKMQVYSCVPQLALSRGEDWRCDYSHRYKTRDKDKRTCTFDFVPTLLTMKILPNHKTPLTMKHKNTNSDSW